MLFFIGFAIIIWSDQNLSPTLQQELITLIGLLLVILGATIAAYSYLLLSLVRILSFIWKDK